MGPVEWRLRTNILSNRDHTLVMGVVNVTPDSFSDGGLAFATDDAIARGMQLHADGADLVDVGGESTRPYADPVDAAEEIARVVPVVAGLASRGVVVSIDTVKPEVAEAALEAGAEVVNDVTALASDGMGELCAAAGAGVVLMHMRGTPRTMQDEPHYEDVVAEVRHFLAGRAAAAESAGIERSRICVDPGIGFGKTLAHNLALLSRLADFGALGHPVMLGASRKGFLGAILEAAGHPAAASDRDAATSATTALAVASGVAVVRVHDVAAAVQVARIADAIVRVSPEADDRQPPRVSDGPRT
jgi:dihydropteroate synthase